VKARSTANGIVLKVNQRLRLPQPKNLNPLNLRNGKDNPDIKEESAPPEKKKKTAATTSMGRRIYKLESESMDVDD
jgi:hypothetical protein